MPRSGSNNSFLGAWATLARRDLRRRFPKWFGRAYAFNRLANSLTFQVQSRDGQRAVVLFLLLKLQNDFQATIVLLERGLALQAETTLRASLDTLLLLKLCREDARFWRKLGQADNRYRFGLFKAIVSGDFGKISGSLSTKAVEGLREVSRAGGKGGLESSETLARLADRLEHQRLIAAGHSGLHPTTRGVGSMTLLYNRTYRSLSQSVHAMPRALSRYGIFDAADNLKGFRYGPLDDNVELTCMAAWEVLTLGLRTATELLSQPKDCERLQRRFDRIDRRWPIAETEIPKRLWM